MEDTKAGEDKSAKTPVCVPSSFVVSTQHCCLEGSLFLRSFLLRGINGPFSFTGLADSGVPSPFAVSICGAAVTRTRA